VRAFKDEGERMREFARPRIVSSKCLEFEACRYNGARITSDEVRQLFPHADFIPVCPEVEIGLGIPRNPIRILGPENRRLVQPETGRDLTRDMNGFLDKFLKPLKTVGPDGIDGFILKYRSPSCGLKNVKVFAEAQSKTPTGKGAGFFGAAVMERFPGLAVEDEGRLKDYRIREAFLTRLFTLSSFRRTQASGRMRDLVQFQSENKLLLMAHAEKHMRILGRIVANSDKRPVDEVMSAYRDGLEKALASPPRPTSCVNVLMHALGYFKKQLTSREKTFFLSALEDYRAKRVPLSVPVGIMRSHIVRFEEAYLDEQTFFEPYPADLVTVTDSGKGREL
jgi:uncharacterized protein YbgA (DUF1722 family)/uncharacterized protein YbbK (DUF523 family)